MASGLRLGCFVCVLVLTGCTQGRTEPLAVSGTVDLDGKPLAEGTVTLAGEGGGVPETFNVSSGRFEGKATPGKKRVEIRAFKLGKTTKMGDEVIEASPENYLPARFNSESKLTAEVTASGLNPSKFDVQSK